MGDQHVHDNPVRGRFNSWLLAKYEDDFHAEMGARKQQHLGSMSGTVVEIGAGNGVNFRYYPPGVQLVVYEPNRWMHARLQEAARRHAVQCELRPVSASQLDLPDQSVDAAVSRLVWQPSNSQRQGRISRSCTRRRPVRGAAATCSRK